MKKEVDISIVILNYNAVDFLRQCLDSVRESRLQGISLQTIVVDNASTDKSVEVVKKDYPGIRLIQSSKNRGFAAGNNLAKGKTSGRYILFLNPDTVLEQDTLYKVYKYMEGHEDVGVATCRLELVNGELDGATHRGFPTPLNAFFHFSGLRSLFPKNKVFSGYTQGWKLSDAYPHEVEVISGAFFFVRSGLAKEIDWWDEDYYWYGEDIEFCFRIKERGWKVMYLPKIKTLHYKGVTSGFRKETRKLKLTSKRTRKRLAKSSTEAMRIFYRKHYEDKYPRFVTTLVFLMTSLLQRIRVSKV